jgi:hypothetical protein
MRLILIITLAHFTVKAKALDSIMFTPNEVTMIKAQRQAERLSQHRKNGCLICNGILFVSDHDWTVWLNNKMVSSRLKRPDIQIHKVSTDMVSLTWRYKNKEHYVLLRPQQGYDGELRKMID